MKSLKQYSLSLSLSLLIVGASESRGQGPVPLSVMLHDPAPQAEARFGNDVLIVDLDADGIRDIAIGSPGYSVTLVTTPLVSAGQLVIRKGPILGPPSRTRISEPVIAGVNPGPQANAEFGFRMVSGDFNADGHIDVAVSAPGANIEFTGVFTQGEVFFLYGPWDLTVVAPALPYSRAEVVREPVGQRNTLADLHGDRFGQRLAVGEVDLATGLGIDLIVGAPWSAVTVSGTRYQDRGQAWFFPGVSGMDSHLAVVEIPCTLLPHEQQFWGWDVECGNFYREAEPDTDSCDVAVAAYGDPIAGSQCPIPPCPPNDSGQVRVFVDYPVNAFTVDVEIRGFDPGPTSNEGTFGWELAVGTSGREEQPNCPPYFQTLAVGQPYQPIAAPSAGRGVVWFFPGDPQFGLMNNQNYFILVNPATPSLSNYDRFGGGLEFLNYEGSGTIYVADELFVASEWFDYGNPAASGNHGEGRCFLIANSSSGYDQFLLTVDDPTPEERPQSEINQFLAGWGSAAVTAGRVNSDQKEDVAIGNASATYGMLTHAGEVRVVIWP